MDDETRLVADLRAGNEKAFALLLDQYYTSMLRVARMYVATKEAAEDVVSESFLGVIEGIDRFEGRSSFLTWLFRILVNRAKTRGEREARTRPFSALDSGDPGEGPAVDPTRFQDGDHRWAGYWAAPPPSSPWPEERLLAKEARAVVQDAIDALPGNQRLVITLRDVQGFTSAEVCDLLSISEVNQRVLLHRARSKVRAALEEYLRTAAEVAE